MLRVIAVTLSVVCVLALAPDVRAHGGGLDRSGCHHDRRNGGYHCHRGGGSPSSSRQSNSVAQGFLGAERRAADADLVRAAQTLLNHLGCEAGLVDGADGLRTSAAIARFNRSRGDVATSFVIDSALVLRLSSAVSDGQRCLPE